MKCKWKERKIRRENISIEKKEGGMEEPEKGLTAKQLRKCMYMIQRSSKETMLGMGIHTKAEN